MPHPRDPSARRLAALPVIGMVAALLTLSLPSLAQTGPEKAMEHGAAPAPVITVAKAGRGEITETATVTGTLVPREEILVSPQMDGVAITQILVEEGDTVKAGQVLARLSGEMLAASLAQNAAQIARDEAAVAEASSAVAEAEASSSQAAAAFGRTRDLVKTGAASYETFDTRQASARMAAARLASAQASLLAAKADQQYAEAQRQELRVRIAHTEIVAPVGGLVSRRVARLGSVVSMNADPLFRIISDGAIELEAEVPENTLAALHPGQRAQLHVAGGIVRDGVIRLVSPEMNPVTRLGRIRIAIAPGQGGLILGGFGRAVVQTARHDGVLVPLSALLFQPDGPVVQVVRRGVVETRPVVVGLRADDRAEIVKGVAAGDAVVTLSGTFVRGGDHVHAIDADGKGS